MVACEVWENKIGKNLYATCILICVENDRKGFGNEEFSVITRWAKFGVEILCAGCIKEKQKTCG